MDITNIFNRYKEINPEITEDIFNKTYQDFGDEYLSVIENEIKKKDYPSEEITPIQGKMAGIQIPESTSLPTIDTESISNPIATLLPTEQSFQNLNPNSSALGTTAEPTSMASGLERGISSLGENPFDNGEKPPVKNYKEYNNELKGISAELKDIQSQLSPLISQLNNINQAIAEKNDYIQVFNNNPIIKEVEALGLQVKNIDVNNVKNYEEEKAIERYNTLVGSSEFKALVENYNKGIEEINALQKQYQDIAESESFKTLTTQEKNLTEKYNSILESNEYKQSIVDENKRLKEKVNTKTSSTTITTSTDATNNPKLEQPPIDTPKTSVNQQFYGVDTNGETVLISAKNFAKTDKTLIAKDGNTYPIYEREGMSFIDTDEGLKLVGSDGDVSQFPVFGRDFEFYKGKFLFSSEKEDQPTDYYQERRKNFHYVAGGRLSSGVAEKDISGNYISLEDETALYKSYESKGYGNIVGIDEKSQRPIFQLNEKGAKNLNEENGFSVPSDYDKGKAYALDSNRVMSNINEGKEIEDNERQRQEKILGRKVDGALLTEEEINEELISKRTQQLVLQGLDTQQAQEQAGREFVSSQMQKRNETNNWIDYIISEAEKNAEPYNASNGKSFKYHQFTNSERDTWQSLRDDIDFAEFVTSDYAKNKYGTKGDGLEYHFENSKLRKSFLNDYVQYKQKQINDNRRALNSTRDRQLRTDIRVAIDNGDDDALAVARGKREPIEKAYQSIQQKALSNSILANKIENGFDVIKKEDEELAKEYAGYQNGRFGDIVSYTGKSIINGGGKLITDIAGGLLSLGAMFSDRINSAHTAFNVENAQILNALSGNTTDKVTVYQNGDTIVEERLGRMFIKGKDGKLTFSEELTYNPKAFEGFKEIEQYTDENLANWAGVVTNQVGMMAIPSVGGGLLAKATANSARLNKVIATTTKALGKENILTKSLVSFSHNSKNLYTSALWAMEVQNQNYNEAKNSGLTRQQAGVYALVQSGITGAMVHFAPDDKFFKGYDASKKELISLIASNNWTKAKSYATDFAKKVISSNRGELLQENSELLAQNIVDSAFNSVLGENKLQTWEIDELFETAKSTLSVTTFLETFNYLTRGGIKTRGLNSIEKMVVASQIPEIQKQLQEVQDGVWSSALKRDAKDALQYIDKIQQYTKQIPDDVQLKVSETADLVLSMDKIAEYEKKKNETTYPSIKENYEEKIQAENDKIKGILSNAKPKSNNTTDSTSVEQVNNLEGSENPNNTITDANSGESPINNEQGVNSQAVEVQQIEQEKPIENNVSTPTSTEQSNATEEEEQVLPTILEESTPEDDVENEGESIGDILNDPLFINSKTQGSISNKEETQQPTNETLPNEGQDTLLSHLEDDEYIYHKNENNNQDGDRIITIQKTNKQDVGFGIDTSPSYQPIEEYGFTKDDILGLPADATDVEVESVIERKNGDREAIIYFKEKGKTQRENFSIRNSAGGFRKGYSKNKEIVWSLPAVENETLTSSEKVSPNTPKREALKISEYSGERVVYHGTKENIANKIVREGIKFGSELSDTDWRGGGYGVTNQEYFSTSLNPNISKYYSGEHKVGIVKLEINPNANVVTVENEMYAEDLQDYSKELEGVDVVYLKNSGEEELVILNKDAVKIVEAKSFKVSDNVVRFHKSKSTPYKKGKISQQAFDQLIAKLKKPFAKAFKNINILTDWEAFERKAEEYRKQKNGGTDFQNVNEVFNRRLDEIEQGKLGKPLSLGMPNAILRSAGIKNKEMKLFGSKIISKLSKHGYNAKDLTNLPNAVQNPIAVFKGGQEGSFAILTEVKINDKNILVAISKGKGNDIDFNIISSVYRKDGKGVIDWINNDKITYSNKEKSLSYLRTSALIADSTNNTEIISTANIQKELEKAREKIQNFQNPKIENESDAEYMCTPSGVIYGAKLPDGTIYINPEHLNANTPIHEFGHLWEQLMPQRFAKGVELLKNTKAGKELFQELRNNKGYKNYSDEKLWSEVLVTMLGNRGEELYHSNSTSRFVAWVKDFFKGLGNILHKLSNGLIGRGLTPEDKLSTFVKGALSDIMSGKEIIPESNIASKEVPIYLKDMNNREIKQMLDRLGLIKPAQCA